MIDKLLFLTLHLKKIHNVFKRYYHNKETFQEYSGTSYTFACTACSDFISFEQLEHHRCNYQNIQFDCPFCDQVFGHQEQLELPSSESRSVLCLETSEVETVKRKRHQGSRIRGMRSGKNSWQMLPLSTVMLPMSCH